MKQALVLSGEYRTFAQTGANLKKFADLNNMDVYFHMWSTKDQEIQHVYETLQPKGAGVDNPEIWLPLFYDVERRIKTKNPKNLRHNDKVAQNASMHWSRTRAYSFIQEPYDQITYARLDLFIEPFEINKTEVLITPSAEAWGVVSDIFSILPSKAAPAYFLYNNYEAIHSRPFEPAFATYLKDRLGYDDMTVSIHAGERYCPHILLLRSLWLNGIEWEEQNLPVKLQR